MFSIALRFYTYASEAAAKEGTGREGDKCETNSVKLWVPEGHFIHSIYAFIASINGGSAESCSCANGRNVLETTDYLILIFKGSFLC